MIKNLLLYGMCLSALAITACTNDQEVDGTGTVSLRVTDAPTDADNIAGVYITFDRVDYQQEGKWLEFAEFQGPRTINLLELTEGKTELLGDFKIAAGAYSQLRFHLDAAANGGHVSNANTYIEFSDGTQEPLFVPSGTQSGYKAKGEFIVPVNGKVNITADFDVRKSIVKAGATNKWILKPVIRLVVTDQAGTITGSLEGAKEETKYIVYAYANDTYAESESQVPAEGETQFPNAESSTEVHSDGAFTLAFLAPGTYDLIIAAYTNGSFEGIAGNIDNVTVSSLKTTEVNIKF